MCNIGPGAYGVSVIISVLVCLLDLCRTLLCIDTLDLVYEVEAKEWATGHKGGSRIDEFIQRPVS